MKEHCRLALKRIAEALPGVEVRLLRQSRHFVFELKRDGAVRHIAMSVSPKNTDHAILNAVREAKRLLNEKKCPTSPTSPETLSTGTRLQATSQPSRAQSS